MENSQDSSNDPPNEPNNDSNTSSFLLNSASFESSFVRSVNNLLRLTAQRIRGSNSPLDQPAAESSVSQSESVTPSISSDSPNQAAPPPPPSPPAPSESAEPVRPPIQTRSATGRRNDVDASNGAIIITINYVFSDEDDPSNPNRSGSLILTLPNNQTNRDPRTIEEFIRLATQMAYSTIINGLQHKKGITLKSFEEFPQKALSDISDTDCAICLESYQPIIEQEVTTKRRKVADNKSVSTASVASTSPRSTSLGDAVEYLSDCKIEFPHCAIELPCGHIFGQSCASEWLKNHSTCPLCRKVVVKNESTEQPAQESEDTTSSSTESSTFGFGIENTLNPDSPNFRVITRTGFDEIRNMLANSNANSNNDSRASSAFGRGVFQGPSSGTTNSAADNNMFSHITNYFRRTAEIPIFPNTVSSRRSRDGVVTTETSTGNNLQQNPSSAAVTAAAAVNTASSRTGIRDAATNPNTAPDVPVARESAVRDETADQRRQEILDYLNLRSLTDPAPPPPASTARETSSESTPSDESS